MRIADSIVEGIFLRRDNRFRVAVEVDGKEHAAHLPNSGRLGELLIPGSPATLVPRNEEGRRTAFDMVQVFAMERWISTDSRLPNRLIADALKRKALPELGEYSAWKSEPRIEEGRLDFLLEHAGRRTYIEVKSVTLVNSRTAMFPDAPTQRGTKHLEALTCLVGEGHRAVVLFVVQRDDADEFTPHARQDPAFAEACIAASAAGVDMLAFACATDFGEIEITRRISVYLS